MKVPGGNLYIDLRNNGGHAYLIGGTSETEEHFIIAKCVAAGDVAFDIGANVGLFTVWLSGIVGPAGSVFAFEPNPVHFENLKRSASDFPQTRILPVGLGSQSGSFELFVPDDDTMASLRNWTHSEGGAVRTRECSVSTMDNLVREGKIGKPDFIKCDIEGGEADCFEGARAVLDVPGAPIVLFEANINSTRGFGRPISSGMDVLASFSAARYRFFLVGPNGSLRRIDSIDFLHGNILAVPEARSSRLKGAV